MYTVMYQFGFSREATFNTQKSPCKINIKYCIN